MLSVPLKEAQRLSPVGEKAHRAGERMVDERWAAGQGSVPSLHQPSDRVPSLHQPNDLHPGKDMNRDMAAQPPGAPYDNYKYPGGGLQALDRLEQAVIHPSHGYPQQTSGRAKADAATLVSAASKVHNLLLTSVLFYI